MDPNAPKPRNNLPSGLTAANALRATRSLRDARKNAFRKWMDSRIRVKSYMNQKLSNRYERAFLEANRKRAPAVIAKYKAKGLTPVEKIMAERAERKKEERIIQRRQQIAEGSTGLPPFPRSKPLSKRQVEAIQTHGIAAKVPTGPGIPAYRPPILLPSQKETLQTQGIMFAQKQGGTRKRRRT